MFLLAAGLRFAYLHDWQSTPFATVLLGDGREYALWAQRIAAGDWWGSLPFYQAPLYPYFLASLRRLFDAEGENGAYNGARFPQLIWNGKDGAGQTVAPGVYLLRLEAAGDARSSAEVRPIAVVY